LPEAHFAPEFTLSLTSNPGTTWALTKRKA
jgi:hypothetical protein